MPTALRQNVRLMCWFWTIRIPLFLAFPIRLGTQMMVSVLIQPKEVSLIPLHTVTTVVLFLLVMYCRVQPQVQVQLRYPGWFLK